MTPRQTRQLKRKPHARHVRSREIEGGVIHYLEGWHVIAEANRIFGFDGWDRETVDVQCVYSKTNGTSYTAAYVTRIRIRVRDGDEATIREGSGAGEATAQSPGQAHELALKAAETDATKRALMTFGNPFGLSLYAGSREMEKVAQSKPNGSGYGQARAAINGYATTANAPTGGDIHMRDAVTKPLVDAAEDAPPGKSYGQPAAPDPGDAANGANSGEPDNAVDPATSPTGTIDKSALTLAEPKRERNKAHLRFVASRYCLVCGRNRAQAHHLKFTQPGGMGLKTSDEFTVPLCSRHHRELHQSGNERAWWKRLGIDPEQVARELWETHQLNSNKL